MDTKNKLFILFRDILRKNINFLISESKLIEDEIPCNLCGGYVERSIIPDDIWDYVIKDSWVRDANICLNCWYNVLRKKLDDCHFFTTR